MFQGRWLWCFIHRIRQAGYRSYCFENISSHWPNPKLSGGYGWRACQKICVNASYTVTRVSGHHWTVKLERTASPKRTHPDKPVKAHRAGTDRRPNVAQAAQAHTGQNAKNRAALPGDPWGRHLLLVAGKINSGSAAIMRPS